MILLIMLGAIFDRWRQLRLNGGGGAKAAKVFREHARLLHLVLGGQVN